MKWQEKVSVPILFRGVIWPWVLGILHKQYFCSRFHFKKDVSGVAQSKPTDRAVHFATRESIVQDIYHLVL